MPSIILNGQALPQQAVTQKLSCAYQSDLGVQVAAEKIKANQIDEVLYEYAGDKYVLYSTDEALKDLKTNGNTLTIDGKVAKILSISNECNSGSERFSAVSHKAVGATMSDGVSGMAAGMAVVLLKLAGSRTAAGVGLGGLVGFVTGAVKGVGTVAINEKTNHPAADWNSLIAITR